MSKWLALAATVILAGIDQIVKLWAVAVLEPAGSMTVIPGLFRLTFVQNRGAAFGILQGQTVLLSVIVAAVLAAGICVLISGKLRDRLMIWAVALILSGGAGNLIDRVLRGYVVDYLDFSAIFGFPVFNFADCCVVAGALLMLIYTMYQDIARGRGKKCGEA